MTIEGFSSAIDSQFGAAAQAGAISEESPLSALGLFSYMCHWDAHTRKIECGDIEWISMEMLLRGQRFNPEIQELYRNCRNGLSSRWDFWLLVVRSCGTRRPNHDEAQIRIISQTLNYPETISSSRWAWKAAKETTDLESKKFFQILSMYHLLLGQRDSADSMQLYRACFRSDPDELFRRVDLIAPLDIEEVVIDLEEWKRGRSKGTHG
jgi:hypothetical protein